LTAAVALKDFKKPEEEQLGLMFCFCEETFFTALTEGESVSEALAIEFSDGEQHCSNFLSKYSL